MNKQTEQLLAFEMNSTVNTSALNMESPFFSYYLLSDQSTSFFHLLSTILLAVTSIFHSYVPAESQYAGAQQCIFHLTVTLCVIHFQIFFCADDTTNSFSYYFSFDYMIIIFGLASFLWSSMLAHQLWKNFGKHGTSNETLGTTSRLLLGYGIPALFLISALGPASSDETRKRMFSRIIGPLAILFAVPIQIVNIFFFIDLLRKALGTILWYSYDKTLKLKETIYRALVFAMLFYTLALPWLVIIGCEVFVFITKSEQPIKIFSLVHQLFSADGIFLSFVLIIYHKYAWTNSVVKEEKAWENVAYESVTLWEKSVA